MRDDMADLITTRPRSGRNNGRKPYRQARQKFNHKHFEQLDEEDLEEVAEKKHAGILPPGEFLDTYDRKEFGEFLAPLKRFLRKQVGRPWDKVKSEIRSQINVSSVTQAHILQHINVEENIEWIDGVPMVVSSRSGHRHLYKGELYVGRGGILQIQKKEPKIKKQEKSKVIKDPKEQMLFYYYCGINKSWYCIKFTRNGNKDTSVIPHFENFSVTLFSRFGTNHLVQELVGPNWWSPVTLNSYGVGYCYQMSKKHIEDIKHLM